MSKKRDKKRKREKDRPEGQHPAKAPVELEAEPLSARGKKTIGAGIGVLILGFICLSLTDPGGRNWASTLSPALILGAYAIIAFGIFLPDHEEGEAPDESSSKEAISGQPSPAAAPASGNVPATEPLPPAAAPDQSIP